MSSTLSRLKGRLKAIWVDQDVQVAFRAWCEENGMKQQFAASLALKQFLDRNPPKPEPEPEP